MQIQFQFRRKYIPAAITTFLLLVCSVKFAVAQKDKRLIQADGFFEKGEYLTAAGLYDQFLKTDPRKIQTRFPVGSNRNKTGITGSGLSSNDVLFKKAECYRLAHYMNEALLAYGEVYKKDTVKYADAIFWKAICERSLLKTNDAAGSLDSYRKNPNGSASVKKMVDKEAATLNFVSSQVVRADTILYTINKLNSASGFQYGIYAPSPGGSDDWLVTSTSYDSLAKNEVNPYQNRLFTTRIQGGTFINLNETSFDSLDRSLSQGAACMSLDGQTLYLTQWKNEKKGTRSGIYTSKRKGDRWTYPQLFSALQTDGANYQQPYLSLDGQTLFFASDRAGGQGKLDIWYAILAPDGSVQSVTNAGPQVNTSDNEQAPFYFSLAGVLYFSSEGRVGMGGFDLFAASGSTDAWQDAVNMGYPVNSTRDDIYLYAGAEGLRKDALLSSDRGSGCCLETYVLEKRPKKRRLTGKVVGCDGATPIEGAAITWIGDGGKLATVSSGAGGIFSFELNENDDPDSIVVSKNDFNTKRAAILITDIKEENLLLDILSNEDLCLSESKVIIPEQVITLYFDFDKSELKSREQAVLDSVASVLLAYPNVTVQISGYTDGLGTDIYNLKLGEKRATNAANYLKAKGIDNGRVSFESFGKCCPVEEEKINGRDNPAARQKNRRALVYIRK
jgi:OOP family OmpA-OmpF porin